MPKKRNYRREYDTYHAKPAAKKERASRNAARKKMEEAGHVHKGDGRDVDHLDGDPRNNKKSNLKVTSKSKNRSKK